MTQNQRITTQTLPMPYIFTESEHLFSDKPLRRPAWKNDHLRQLAAENPPPEEWFEGEQKCPFVGGGMRIIELTARAIAAAVMAFCALFHGAVTVVAGSVWELDAPFQVHAVVAFSAVACVAAAAFAVGGGLSFVRVLRRKREG